jgi:hypothetical protein
MTAHITITLRQMGQKTQAQTLFLQDANGIHYTATSDSGAKALTNLVEMLVKDHAGSEFTVEGDPSLSGTIPKHKFRRPWTRRKKETRLIQ